MSRITPISIEFKDGRTPYSPLFKDVYYTHDTGIPESTYVYLEGSGFCEALTDRTRKHFCIGEIGFGVGLNFLLTLRHFLENSSPDQKLTYITVEKHPVILKDLIHLYSQIPELDEVSKPLLDQYPILTPGIHTLSFDQGRVTLILMFGDAKVMFSNLNLPNDQKIQFWYWDGFAPDRNPDAFEDLLFKSLIPLSTSGAQATSFTSAGWVRRGLSSTGFEVKKRPGFGTKRECIQIRFPTQQLSEKIKSPWFSDAGLKKVNPGDRIVVIGAGLSGTAIARALAKRGFSVQLVDQESIAAHASGNKTGLFNVQLSKRPNPISRFSQLSLIHFMRELQTLPIQIRKGILRLDAVREKEAFDEALRSSEYPMDFFESRNDGIFFPECGILNPSELCKARANHPLIQFTKSKISEIRRSSAGFSLHDSKGLVGECEHIVYATGSSQVLDRFLDHPLLTSLPIRPIRGQVIHVSTDQESEKIDCALVDSGYITPSVPEISGSHSHCIGATYQAKAVLPDQESIDSEKLLEEAKVRHPAFRNLTSDRILSHRVGYRLSTPDKLPMIGPLCDFHKMKPLYSTALRSGKISADTPLPAEQGEWLFLGMGSRGVTFSSYGAEILAALMCGEALPIETDLWEHVHSARFIVRELKKPEAPDSKLG